MKFTFKMNYERYRPKYYHIKFKKKWCGSFDTTFSGQIDKIRFMIDKDEKFNDSNPNCSWMWISFDVDFKSVDECKEWLNNNIEMLFKKYKIHCLEE